MSSKARAFTQSGDNGTQDAFCAMPGCFFESTGWPTKKTAQARIKEHLAEHDNVKDTTPELADFRERHNVDVHTVTVPQREVPSDADGVS